MLIGSSSYMHYDRFLGFLICAIKHEISCNGTVNRLQWQKSLSETFGLFETDFGLSMIHAFSMSLNWAVMLDSQMVFVQHFFYMHKLKSWEDDVFYFSSSVVISILHLIYLLLAVVGYNYSIHVSVLTFIFSPLQLMPPSIRYVWQ